MISDRTDLTGYEMKRDGYYGDKGKRFEPAEADPIWFWAYALAWRLTGVPEHWQMARDVGRGNGLGDIGESPDAEPALNNSTTCSDPLALLGLLEIHRKTGSPAWLRAAQRVGDNILTQRFDKGFFLPSKDHLYARFDSVEALALLHLAAALRGESDAVPAYCAGRAYLHCPFDGIGRTYDTVAIYARRRD
jgi:pectate lyase